MSSSSERRSLGSSNKYALEDNPSGGGGGSGTFSLTGTTTRRTSSTTRPWSSLQRTSRNNSSLSELTVNKLRFSKLTGGLYGRDQEIQILSDCLQRTVDNNNNVRDNQSDHNSNGVVRVRQVVLISGNSGVGKSALAAQLQKPAQQQADGYYAAGKFDFNRRDEPYSGIVAACHSLCQDLLRLQKYPQNKVSFQHVSEKFRHELGNEAQLLIKIIPALADIILHGKEDSTRDLVDDSRTGVTEARNRFHFAFRRFVRSVGSFGPLVLVMDDIQWADSESLDLLEVLLSDPQSPSSLMLVCCYRSNEMNETHIATKWIRDIEAGGVDWGLAVVKLPIGNLTVAEANALLADVLSATVDRTENLAHIVHKKTLGNVFFIIQFLKSLNERELLEYNLGLTKWVWDEKEIELQTSATDNVVALLKGKMRELPLDLYRTMSLAACLGSNFSERILELIVDAFEVNGFAFCDAENAEEVQEKAEKYSTPYWLDVCEDEGFIEPAGIDSFRWVHDKIQEAVIALVRDSELPALRYHVGKVLANAMSAEEVHIDIFVIVNLLNEGDPSGLIDSEESMKLAELNLQAGKRAIESASFKQAATYLKKGIGLLPSEHWNSHYNLSLELFSLAAQAEYCTGDVDTMEKHCNAVIAQTDRPLKDKFRAYNVLVDSTGNRNHLKDAMDILLAVLSQLGCHFPKRGRMLFTLAGLIRTKATIKNRTPEEIAKLNRMEDDSKVEAMRLLDKLATFSYLAQSELLPLCILKSLRWTLRYGVSAFSPPAFATVGLILCAHLVVSHMFCYILVSIYLSLVLTVILA